MSRHMLSCMSKTTRILFHLAVLCDSLRCGAYLWHFLLWHIRKCNNNKEEDVQLLCAVHIAKLQLSAGIRSLCYSPISISVLATLEYKIVDDSNRFICQGKPVFEFSGHHAVCLLHMLFSFSLYSVHHHNITRGLKLSAMACADKLQCLVLVAHYTAHIGTSCNTH